jgi:hypothetical protein
MALEPSPDTLLPALRVGTGGFIVDTENWWPGKKVLISPDHNRLQAPNTTKDGGTCSRNA